MAGPGDHLDADEQRLLMLIASGFSAAEAGDELGIGIMDVAERLRSLRARLAVNSTAEAIEVVLGGRQR